MNEDPFENIAPAPRLDTSDKSSYGVKRAAIEYKGNACLDCGRSFPACVYDFHHRDPKEKSFIISKPQARSWREIRQEIDKCDMLCANCHRIRHHKENCLRNGWTE